MYINEAEVLEILGDVLKNGRYFDVILCAREKLGHGADRDYIKTVHLRNILGMQGMITDSDAGKVVHMITERGTD